MWKGSFTCKSDFQGLNMPLAIMGWGSNPCQMRVAFFLCQKQDAHYGSCSPSQTEKVKVDKPA